MKKLVALLLALTLLVVFVACNKNQKPSENQTTKAESTTKETDSGKAEEKVKFEFFHGLGGNLGAALESIIADFNASQDKYECVPVAHGSYGDAFTAFQAALAAKKPPALIQGIGPESARKGLYIDVLEFINEDPEFALDDILDAYVEQCLVDGKLYLLPQYGTGWMLFYDKNAFAEAGIDADEALDTWDGLAEAARKLTKRDEKGETTYYGWEPMWGYANMYYAALSYGGKVFSEDGKTVTINSDEWVTVWEKFRSWIHEEKIMRIHYGGEGWEHWYKTMDDVLEGRAAGFIGTAGDLAELDWDKVDVHPFPGWKGVGSGKIDATCIKMGIVASADSEQQRAAYEFYKYLISPANCAKWTIETGYIPVRESTLEAPEFLEFTKDHPYMAKALDAIFSTGIPPFEDPTGGKIWDALSIAGDKVQIENIPAKTALDEAQKEAQKALDEYLAKQQ